MSWSPDGLETRALIESSNFMLQYHIPTGDEIAISLCRRNNLKTNESSPIRPVAECQQAVI